MFFRIADFKIGIFKEGERNVISLLPSFLPFTCNEENDEELLFSLTVDDNLPIREENQERIGTFDTGNGDIDVDRFEDGAYQFFIKDVKGEVCCLLQCDKQFSVCKCALKGSDEMRSFGLNNALMIIFAFASCGRQTLLMHASLVRHNGVGYAFIAKSGTGKSTQVSNWLRYIPNCDLMNDDNPIIRLIEGKVFVYGSPWSGKTPCYRQTKAPLGAIVRIVRDDKNWMESLRPLQSFGSLLTSCSTMKWDNTLYNCICDNISTLVAEMPIYSLHCLPDRESAVVCCKELCGEEY